jgi:hypothetical protein
VRKTISILFALALVLSFSLVATTPMAAATTYYVATTGDNGNDGFRRHYHCGDGDIYGCYR